jgi:hypothetical protein
LIPPGESIPDERRQGLRMLIIVVQSGDQREPLTAPL